MAQSAEGEFRIQSLKEFEQEFGPSPLSLDEARVLSRDLARFYIVACAALVVMAFVGGVLLGMALA